MADNAAEDHGLMLEQFRQMSGASKETALQYLEANGWNMLNACSSFFADEDEAKLAERKKKAAEGTLEEYDGPRTLDGRPAPRGDFRPPRAQPKKTGVATLGSIGGSRAAASGHNHDDDDDDDDDDDYDDGDSGSDDDDKGRGDLFAGGEKSALAVQDPRQQQGSSRKILQEILAKAKAAASDPSQAGREAPTASPHFRGTGMTLGGDGVESRAIPDPLGPPRPSRGPPEERVLHLWKDGFSVDDGELCRFDDPAHQMDLRMIRAGRAPLHLMNVAHDQAVDVKLKQHESNYKPSPKKYKPFGGSGHRLGSPVPGAPDPAAAQPAQPAPSNLSASTTAAAAAPGGVQLDASQPTLTIRIQLPDGTRLPARFNATHTVGDVYGFVRGASPETRTRSWVLATIFPNQEHTDHAQVLGEMPEFKRGGTAVVKWA